MFRFDLEPSSIKRMPTLLATAVVAAMLFTFAAADPICIVGAGPAGLTIANRLQAKGLDTVVFEKDPEVGGKCQAFYDEK
jgi:ribulose 1,5-bisphosphate synthetase/thiazole synthase